MAKEIMKQETENLGDERMVEEIMEEEREKKYGLEYLEGYCESAKQHSQFSEIQIALALYEIKKSRLYVQAGFKSFDEYIEARDIPRRTAFRWAKDVEVLSPETFREIAARVGISHSFFKRFALLPTDIKDAIVKDNRVVVNGKEYDFKGKNSAEYKNLIFALLDELNKWKKAYDTSSRHEKTLKEKDERIKRLEYENERLRNPIPEDTKEAINALNALKEKAKMHYRMLDSVRPEAYKDELVRIELLNLCYYLQEVFTILAHRISNRYDTLTPYPAHILETEKKAFVKKYKGDDALEIDLEVEEEGVA